MKKLAAVFLLILMVFSFVSCGGKGVFDTTPATPDGGDISFVPVDDGSETTSLPVETEPSDAPITTITFAGCGDNIVYVPGTTWEAAAQAYPGGRAYNFKPIYSDVASTIAAADISYINQETLMDGDEPASYPMFNSPQDLGYDLVELGWDVVHIANNHMLDRGGDGLSKTIEFWKGLDTVMIGGNRDHDDYDDIEIIERGGIKVALLSYCEMTNGLVIGKNYDIWIPYLDEADIQRHCDSVRDKCDLILCSVHWGDEGSFTPNEKQKKWAKVMADAGVDVIIGTHPHVIQPIEYIEGKDGNRTLCVYSLGNFMAMQADDYNMLGGIISFNINKRGSEHAYVDNVLFTPTMYYFARNWYGSHVYFLSDVTEDIAASHGIGNYGNVLSLQTLRYYLNNTIDNEYLPEEFRK
ncbi:MAG: CapA family protein [Clostridia bacterium]|nr:CapA family protein [Clostridia bacterium]